MPTYEYLCRQCGHRLEVVQSFSDDPLTSHDSCGGSLRKVFHARGVVFKGSGFYVTDSRGPNPANRSANGQDSSPSKDPTTDSASKTEKSRAGSSERQKASSK